MGWRLLRAGLGTAETRASRPALQPAVRVRWDAGSDLGFESAVGIGRLQWRPCGSREEPRGKLRAAEVPAGAASGPITVMTPGGTVTTKANFTIQ